MNTNKSSVTSESFKESFKVTGNWESQVVALKAKFSKLRDEDLKFEKGRESELISRISERLEKKPEEVINILKKGDKI